ncbi:GumC family protein [Vulcanococcus limneticus]|uniref:GumC family protein n=1 Tax=Vulcanococcus limneticus TaxID=2170428 RepID=UPI00398C13B4
MKNPVQLISRLSARMPAVPQSFGKAARLFTEQFRNIPGLKVPDPKGWWHGLSRTDKLRWSRYLFVSTCTNTLIWGSSILYLVLTKPVYTSTWALILPGSANAVNVSLPGIGQATASNESLGLATFDPRANYEYIFVSEQVLAHAAKIAKIPKEKFAEPRIKNIDNTTLMQIDVTGPSPEDARKRAHALYDAMVERLNELRVSEIDQRQGPAQKILLETQKKLEDAQRKVSAYKQKSGLTSIEQVESLSANIEQLRKQRAELAAQQAQAESRLQKLSRSLGLSPSEAADAFKLQVDQIFQQTLKDYSEASAILKVQLSKFGRNNPRILKEIKRQDAAKQAMNQRAIDLLGRPASARTLIRLALTGNSSGRDSLFQTLVNYQSEASGAASQVSKLDEQISSLEGRLKWMSQRQSTLENLKRNEQIAETVFASTLAKLDLGQSNIFAAFPLIQIAVEPSLPDKATSPKRTLVLAGSAFGSILTTTGLWILWIRKPWIKRLSRWIST